MTRIIVNSMTTTLKVAPTILDANQNTMMMSTSVMIVTIIKAEEAMEMATRVEDHQVLIMIMMEKMMILIMMTITMVMTTRKTLFPTMKTNMKTQTAME